MISSKILYSPGTKSSSFSSKASSAWFNTQNLGKLSLADLVPAFADQAQGLIDGGADVLILETCQDILEMKAQIIASREAMVRTGKKVPIQCSITLDPTGRMLLGTDYRGALATLEARLADAR